MQKQKSVFIFVDLIIIILLLFPIGVQSFNKYQNSNNTNLAATQPIIKEDYIFQNYLFSYESVHQKEEIKEILSHYSPATIHFYENFPIGFVSLNNRSITRIKQAEPSLYTFLIPSAKKQALPSTHELITASNIQNINQDEEPLPGEIINADALWDLGITGTGSKIAIIDSGVDAYTSHGAFGDRIIYSKSFVSQEFGFEAEEDIYDNHGHGTHVAGIAAGGGSTYPGIAYNASIINLKAADMSGYSTVEAIMAALDEAILQEVDVVSISIGFDITTPWGKSDILSDAVNSAVDKGIVVVVSAGNSGEDSDFASINTPASASKAISVGATNGSRNVMSFSSHGPSIAYKIEPTILAPGYQIVAPLAPGCIIELAYESIVGISLGNYIRLSGTSMAAPIVSGAIALLKELFPTASPEALRAALQEGARSMNESIYVEGSGLIDVYQASMELLNAQEGEDFTIISSLPKSNTSKPLEFTEKISFPGDEAHLGISIVTGSSGVIEWLVSPEIEKFLNFNSSPETFFGPSYLERMLNVSIPLNATPGEYRGSITYIFKEKTYYLPLEFTIRSPSAKGYLYSHYFESSDTLYFNYRALDNFLASEKSIDLDEFHGVISLENLSRYDFLLLTDLEYPLSVYELDVIKEFHDNGGSILLVTSVFPYFKPEPYSYLSTMLGLPFDFDNRIDIVNYIDDGRNRYPSSGYSSELTWNHDDSLFNGVANLDIYFGSAFGINGPVGNLKHVAQFNENYYGVAAYEPINKGKVLALGAESWIYQSSFDTISGMNFVDNIFTYLNDEDNLIINSGFGVLDRTLQSVVYSPLSNLNLSADIILENGTKITNIDYEYQNSSNSHSLNLIIPNDPNYRYLKIQIKNGSSILKTYFERVSIEEIIFVLDIEVNFQQNNVTFPSWIPVSSRDFIIDESLNIIVNHTTSTDFKSILIVSNQLEDTLDVLIPPLSTLESVENQTFFKNDSTNLQSLSWPLPTYFPTGSYSFDVQTWYKNDLNVSVLSESMKGVFFVVDQEPFFDEKSEINGKSLEYYRSIETSADLMTWSPGEKINFDLTGHDENGGNFIVTVQLLHYYLWFADRIVLDYFTLPTDQHNSSKNVGIWTFPSNPIPLPDEESLEVEIENQIFVFLLFIRDNQGNSEIEVVLFVISSGLNIDLFSIVVIGIFAIGGVITVILIRKRARNRPSYYMDPYRAPLPDQTARLKFKYCYKCGVRLPIEAQYCHSCGAKV